MIPPNASEHRLAFARCSRQFAPSVHRHHICPGDGRPDHALFIALYGVFFSPLSLSLLVCLCLFIPCISCAIGVEAGEKKLYGSTSVVVGT